MQNQSAFEALFYFTKIINHSTMKKFIIMMVCLAAINLTCFAVSVPKAVTDAFTKKFLGATSVKWGKESVKEYEAEFKLNGKTMSANFLADGNWTETEAMIAVAELPAAVVASVTAKYPGYAITGADKIEKPGGKITYEAEIKKGSKKSEVILTENGIIIK
jgi:Putative beta-lactamase-inhibitor-like, PepSY-like